MDSNKSMNSPRILALVDPLWQGHSPAYFSICWEIFARMPGVKVVGFCPHPEKARASLVAHGIQDPEVREFADDPAPPANASESKKVIVRWQRLAQALRHAESEGGIQISLTFIIWLEPFLGRHVPGKRVDKIFPFAWAGLYLHPYHFRFKTSRRFWLRERLFPAHAPLLAANCRAVLTLDEGIVQAMSRKLAKPVLRMPDVTNPVPGTVNSEIARQIRPRAAGRFVCGLFGVLQKRKGILPLLKAAEARPPGWFFVFAGELQKNDFSMAELDYIEQFAKSAPDNCLFWTQKIPDEAGFNAAMAECDVIYAAYEMFPHSSNIMTKAALLQKPIIVSPGFLMAERVAAFNLGWVLPANSDQVVGKFFAALTEENVQSLRAKALFKEYLKEHSHQRLDETFSDMLKLTA